MTLLWRRSGPCVPQPLTPLPVGQPAAARRGQQPVTRGETLVWAGLGLLAFLLRLYDLGHRALHHDESLHAVFAWRIVTGAGYHYDPMMHGPYQFHQNALFLWLFHLLGADLQAGGRMGSVVCGTALVLTPFLLRTTLGRNGAVVLALLYFSRFIREDLPFALWTLLAIGAFFQYLEPGPRLGACFWYGDGRVPPGVRRRRSSRSASEECPMISVVHRGRSARAARLFAVMLCAVVAGVAGAAPIRQALVAHAAPPATLRIWYATDDPTEGPMVQALAQRFQAAHSGVQVSLTIYALSDMNAKLQLALGAGRGPDLLYTTPRGPGLPAYVRAGLLRDLREPARHLGWASSLRPGLLTTYNDALSPSGRAGGQVYAVPYVLAAVALLYNQALVQRLRLSLPRSLAQLEAFCARVKRAGQTPIGLGNADGWVGDDWYSSLVNALAGPEALGSELRLDPHFSFSGAAFAAAGATLQRWATQGYFTPDFGGLDAQDSVVAFFEGHTALQLISSTQNGQISALARTTHLPIGVLAFPSADARRPPVMPQSGYAGWAVPQASRQPLLAEAFITQMLSTATAQALLGQGLLPARQVGATQIESTPPFQRAYLRTLASAAPGVYLDGAPVPNLNATMEANLQLLLQQDESPPSCPTACRVSTTRAGHTPRARAPMASSNPVQSERRMRGSARSGPPLPPRPLPPQRPVWSPPPAPRRPAPRGQGNPSRGVPMGGWPPLSQAV